MTENDDSGVCIKVARGKREAIIWIDPKTKEYRVVKCNWFPKCIKCGVLLNGRCPGYCDLVSSAKHYLRGRRRREVYADFIPPSECAIIKYANSLEEYDYRNVQFDDILDDFPDNIDSDLDKYI